MARDKSYDDDDDERTTRTASQRPWKKRRERERVALSCSTIKGFASLQPTCLPTLLRSLHARDEARRRRRFQKARWIGGFRGREREKGGEKGREERCVSRGKEERKKEGGGRERDRVQEIKEVDDNAAVVRPLAQGAQGGHYIVLLFRAYAAISA